MLKNQPQKPEKKLKQYSPNTAEIYIEWTHLPELVEARCPELVKGRRPELVEGHIPQRRANTVNSPPRPTTNRQPPTVNR